MFLLLFNKNCLRIFAEACSGTPMFGQSVGVERFCSEGR